MASALRTYSSPSRSTRLTTLEGTAAEPTFWPLRWGPIHHPVFFLPKFVAHSEHFPPTQQHITWVPIQCKMIDKSLLTQKEINWVNMYNSETRRLLEPLITHDPLAIAWLHKETAPL